MCCGDDYKIPEATTDPNITPDPSPPDPALPPFQPPSITEAEGREAIVKEAVSWLGTPFEHGQCLKGVACDCATFIAGVYSACGLIPETEQRHNLLSDWYLHTSVNHYKRRLLRYAREIVTASATPTKDVGPGDIVLVGHIRADAHGGIVEHWPIVIHAHPPCVRWGNLVLSPEFAGYELTYFSPWGKSV
jgi:cell wall-associated NlpC family hydrolase